MRDIDEVLAQLAKSRFRQRFALKPVERAYLESKGLAAVLDHARGFVAKRLAPAHPTNDGKQSPYRGHPAFSAQHATATCCRGCLEKWHHIPRSRTLDTEQQTYILAVIERWLKCQGGNSSEPREPRLL